MLPKRSEQWNTHTASVWFPHYDLNEQTEEQLGKRDHRGASNTQERFFTSTFLFYIFLIVFLSLLRYSEFIIVLYTVQAKSLDTPSHSMRFLYFHDYLHCRFSLKASKLWMNTWNYVLNKKVWNNWKHVLYFRFFKVATLCFFINKGKLPLMNPDKAHLWR